jgi:hypothetical protein
MIRAQRGWSQPKFTHHPLAAHVDMWRFLTIKAIEEQAIGGLGYWEPLACQPP